MSQADRTAESAKFMSITGQSLDLDLNSKVQGEPNLLFMLMPTDTGSGQCVPVNAFDKLNRLGEGSKAQAYGAFDSMLNDDP